MDFDEAADFAVESIEAIPVGANLAAVTAYWFADYQAMPWSAEKHKAKVLDLLRNAPVGQEGKA